MDRETIIGLTQACCIQAEHCAQAVSSVSHAKKHLRRKMPLFSMPSTCF